jgi:hypothetical protein
VARISIDYDLMTVLARQTWTLRDDLERAAKVETYDFPAADIGPRRETAEALNNFYEAWQKAFGEAWQVMTDLGDLLDSVGKVFYDQDAATAAGAAQQISAHRRQSIEAEHKAYWQRQEAARKEEQVKALSREYENRQAPLRKKWEKLQKEQGQLQKEYDAQEQKQLALQKEYKALAKEMERLLKQQEGGLEEKQEALQKKWDDLEQRQEALREEQAASEDKQEALGKKEEALGKEEEALQKEYDRKFDELKNKTWDPASGEPDPLSGREPEQAPPPVPKDYKEVSDRGTTEVSYKLDENGEVMVNAKGDPVETTTTITNQNGLTYKETTTLLSDDGDSRTVIQSSDGSVTKVHVDVTKVNDDSSPGGRPEAAEEDMTNHHAKRTVTDGQDVVQQVWEKEPGSDEWKLTYDLAEQKRKEEEEKASKEADEHTDGLTAW